MEIEATQAIPLSDYDEDDETDDEIEAEKPPVGFLKVLLRKGYPEKQFAVYEGCNMIGRDATCNIQIDLKALSKQHAYIEVKSGQHFVVDNKSKNKTRRNKIYLMAEARYEVCDGDHLMFADVECIYSKNNTSADNKSITEEKTLVDDSLEEDRSEPSSDLLQPTQKFPGNLGDIKNEGGFGGSSKFMYASDSEESESGNIENPFRKEETLVAETPIAVKVKAGMEATLVPDSQALDVTCLSEGPTETVIFEEEASEDESEAELRRRIAMEPTQAYGAGNVVDDSDTTDGEAEDSAGFEGCEVSLSSAKKTSDPRGDTKTSQTGKGVLSATVKYSMDIESTQLASEIKSKQIDTTTAKTLAYDMDLAPTQTDFNAKVTESTEKDDSMGTGSQDMPTQTFAPGNEASANENSSEEIPESKINLGFGATMAYEYDECTSDEEDYIIPLKKKYKDDNEEATEAETQVINENDNTVAVEEPMEEDATQCFEGSDLSRSNQKNQGLTAKIVEETGATQCFETVAVGGTSEVDHEAPTQVLDEDAPTQEVAEVSSHTAGKTKNNSQGKSVCDAEAPTQVTGQDAETQVFETLEVDQEVEKVIPLSGSKAAAPQNIVEDTSLTETQVVDSGEDYKALGVKSKMSGRGRGKQARGRGRRHNVEDKQEDDDALPGSRSNKTKDDSADFETQVFETISPTKPTNMAVDASAATQMLDDTETQEIVVGNKTMIKSTTGKFSPHREETFETMDETQVFDKRRSEEDTVLHVRAVTSVTNSKVNRQSLETTMAATQRFDDGETPHIVIKNPPHIVGMGKHTDEIATQLFKEVPTQAFPESDDTSTQSLEENQDRFLDMDMDGFVKPKLPVARKNEVVTDDLCTQVYDQDTDDEEGDGKTQSNGEEKNNNEDVSTRKDEDGNGHAADLMAVSSDQMETQAYEMCTETDESPVFNKKKSPMKKSEKLRLKPLIENTDLMATQVFSDESEKFCGNEGADNLATQAYELEEEEEELPDLAMELSVAESSTSKTEEPPSRQTRIGGPSKREEVIESSQSEHDRQPISAVPVFSVKSPEVAARGSKRKLVDKTDESLKKQKLQPEKPTIKSSDQQEIESDIPVKGKRGRKRKNTLVEESTSNQQDAEDTESVKDITKKGKGKGKCSKKAEVAVKKETDMDNKITSVNCEKPVDATMDSEKQGGNGNDVKMSEEPVAKKLGRGRKSLKGGDDVVSEATEEKSNVAKKGDVNEDIASGGSETISSSGRGGRRKTSISNVEDDTMTTMDDTVEKQGNSRGRGRKKDLSSNVPNKNKVNVRQSLRAGKGKDVSPAGFNKADTGTKSVEPLSQSRRSEEPSPALSNASEELSQKSRRQSNRRKDPSPALSNTSEELSQKTKRKSRKNDTSPALSNASEDLSQRRRSRRSKAPSPAVSHSSEDLSQKSSRNGRSQNLSPALSNTSDDLTENSKKHSANSTHTRTASMTDDPLSQSISSTRSKGGRGRGKGRGMRSKDALETLIIKTEPCSHEEPASDQQSEPGISKGRGQGRGKKSASSISNVGGSKRKSVASGIIADTIDPHSRNVQLNIKTTTISNDTILGKSRKSRLKQIDAEEQPVLTNSRQGACTESNNKNQNENVQSDIGTTSGPGEKDVGKVGNRGSKKTTAKEVPVSKKSRRGASSESNNKHTEPEEISTSKNEKVVPSGRATRGTVKEIKQEVGIQEVENAEDVHQKSTKRGGKNTRGKKNGEVKPEQSSSVAGKNASKTAAQSDLETSSVQLETVIKKCGNKVTVKKERRVTGPSTDRTPVASTSILEENQTPASSTPKSSRGKAQILSAVPQSQTPVTPTSRRRTLERKPRIMFTGVVDEEGQKIVKSLGGELVESITDCTHLVTDKVRRTVKFLCGVARGLYIVNITWLERCQDAKMFIDAKPFLIKDKSAEKTHGFNLAASLEKALGEGGMFTGHKLHVTKNVKPGPDMMRDIITSAGGEFLASMPKKVSGDADKTLVISCPEDSGLCKAVQNQGVTVVGAEFILTGILRQEFNTDLYKLGTSQSGKGTKGGSKKR